MFTNLLKAAAGVTIGLPVAAVADFVTLGGACNERENTYTGDVARAIVGNVEQAIAPDKEPRK